jgi:hypothetical protein
MAKRNFTQDEMEHLKASPYVLDVSLTTVHFSAAFKRKFWDALLDGKNPREIVSELGVDPDVLGVNRLYGLQSMISKELKAGKGFRDLTTFSQGLNQFMSAENKVKYLEQQLAYKEQEIEFLKKIVSLGQEKEK